MPPQTGQQLRPQQQRPQQPRLQQSSPQQPILHFPATQQLRPQEQDQQTRSRPRQPRSRHPGAREQNGMQQPRQQLQRGHHPQPGARQRIEPQPQPHMQRQPRTHPPRRNQQTNNRTDSQQPSNRKTIKILQLNINGLTSKTDELKDLLDRPNMDIDVITLQETKLKKTSKTPKIPNFTAVRKDRPHRTGGGLMTYIKNDIIFTDIKTPQNINQQLTELQHIKIHLTKHKALNIHNVYIPPTQ